jgi:hypothetical protein
MNRKSYLHCKKGLLFSPPQPGWLVTSQLGMGKSLTVFTVYQLIFERGYI